MHYNFIEVHKLKDEFIYRVKQGENLALLSERFNITVEKLILDNNLTGEVHAGMLLSVKKSNRTVYTVMPGDTVEKIAGMFKTDKEIILKNNNIEFIHPFMKIYI